jgi:hypothetical protein
MHRPTGARRPPLPERRHLTRRRPPRRFDAGPSVSLPPRRDRSSPRPGPRTVRWPDHAYFAVIAGTGERRITARSASPFGALLVHGQRFPTASTSPVLRRHRGCAHDGRVLAAGRKFDPFIGWLGLLGPYTRRMDRLHKWWS